MLNEVRVDRYDCMFEVDSVLRMGVTSDECDGAGTEQEGRSVILAEAWHDCYSHVTSG